VFSVVVATPDAIGERMAGPGIRAWNLARELAKHVNVTLIGRGELADVQHGTADAKRIMRDADVLIGQPARGFRKRRAGQKVVYDLFDPLVLELRELYGHNPSPRQRVHLAAEWWRLTWALRTGDLLMCATSRQRAFYGALQSSDTAWVEVPFGVDLAEVQTCPKPQDNIVIWGGGLWEWLDPGTAVDAIVNLNREGLRCRLLFLGRTRPNPHAVERRREDRFERLLARGGQYVSANAEWVPYRERLSWLRAGKVAIMLHRPTPEAVYSIRTRLFDAIAAAIPVVATSEGFAAELVAREGLGLVVPPGDTRAVSDAVRLLLTDDGFYTRCVENLERIRPQFAWHVVTRPLIETVMAWRKRAER
jgi:glycosyltransferase involved in cell wall biosynthesis